MSRLAFALLALLASTAPFRASAAEEAPPPADVYEGAVGDAPIVMKLEGSDGSYSGNYFYRSRRFDIDLSGDEAKGVLTLESRLTGDRLSLKRNGGGFDGELTTAKGKRLPAHLHKVSAAPGDVPADLPKEIDLYEKLRISGLALKADKAETVSGRNIRWYVEPKSGNRVFRIESGYPEPVMAAINRSLTGIQWLDVANYFGCPSSEGGSGRENSEVKNRYLSDDYVSFATFESWSCAGAAHPDFGIEEHTFDAKTGRELEVDDVLKFGKGPVPAKDSDAWYDYRGKTFSPALVALMKRLHPKEMKKPKEEDGCDYTDPEVWDFPTWYPTEKGLYVGAIFARVARVCDDPEWSVIPWAEVKKLR